MATDPLFFETGLTLLLANPTGPAGGAVELPLSEGLVFFDNIGVDGWTPVQTLLETTHTEVTIQGSRFVESEELECLWYGNG